MNKMNLLQKLSIVSTFYGLIMQNLLIFCNCSMINREIPFIYSSLYIQKFDIQDPQSQFTKIKVAEKSNQAFVSAGYEGLLVIDNLTKQVIFTQKSWPEYLFAVEVTSDGEYVMFSQQNQFSIFKFQNSSSLILISQSSFPSTIIDLLINHSENIVYAIGISGCIVAFDISNKYSIQNLAQYQSQTSFIHQGYISKDDKWIILGNDDLGLTIISVQNYSKNNSLELVLAGQGMMQQKTSSIILTNDNQYAYGVDLNNGIYVSDFNQILSAGTSQYPIQIQFTFLWPLQNYYAFQGIQITNDNRFLFVGVRSYGIFVLDIQERLNPILFQQIRISGQPMSLALSHDEKYLYYSNSQSLFVFEQTNPNLNNYQPNLFNGHQSKLYQDDTQAHYKWRCLQKTIKQKKYLFQTLDTVGFNILEISSPYNIYQIYFYGQLAKTSGISSLALSLDNRYLYVPLQQNNTVILVLDISDIVNPKEAFRFRMPILKNNEAIFFSKDYNYLVSSYDNGILLIDSSQPPQLFLLDYWKMLSNMTGENAGVMITNDNRYIISTIRGYGIYVLDASNKTSLQYKSTYLSSGAEGIIPSMYNNTYAFLFDGFKGVAIIDLRALPQILFLSRIRISGWSNYVQPVFRDQYLLVSIMDTSMLHLINIEDITKPYEISSYQYGQLSSFSLCMSDDNQFAFIQNSYGTIILPLASQNIPQEKNVQVGQIIQFDFMIIYPTNGIIIQKVQYYKQGQVQDLPFWMQYNSNNQQLLITVDKSSLDLNNLKIANLNSILITTLIPLEEQIVHKLYFKL
ncbi:calpain family cysteine protease, putative (macronuclear) [Tetrahymena thermophila SB210]|uniref:Calpain family cysteine protease, putative n=1 Tax=Tetrahymena thermophila (strain SB210) TaxID=312017 RepID=I7MCI8_TETTS|nr:calpain family cysteine protease, putative [Tetrahymena thermophila SB210]EAR84025.2 calpain family cysteine protease, putative [Tetrahymena thermophila SB210]|eukprot:XP_001031688.2 calpain family cysteine protease, putative [Tetrahymena thermophila SB210]